MSAVDPQQLRSFVSRVAATWSGYQLAVDLSSGGPETKQKHEWFIDVLSEYLLTTHNLNAEHFEDWINNLLYAEFDLILEDDSTYPTAQLLIEAYGYMKSNNLAQLSTLEASLPSQQVVQEAKRASRREGNDEDDEMMDMDDVEEESDEEEVEKPQRERLPRTVTDDDGWTTIVKR